jgi:UvrB/uvrC motif
VETLPLSKDLASILAGWQYDPDEPQVRIVPGEDGRDKLQMRLDLGLLQMELEGRPDGERPLGFESLLDSYEADAGRVEPAKESGTADATSRLPLDGPACEALLREGLQYYHRYLALFHLERYDLVARDTARNLRLFAFVVKHASRTRDKVQFDQYRPYVTMMHARALASQALATNDHQTALAELDTGIAGIRAFLREYDQAEDAAHCAELHFLLRWRGELEQARPVGPIERLEQQLGLAVATERFEEAARLRDQLQRLRPPEPQPARGPKPVRQPPL